MTGAPDGEGRPAPPGHTGDDAETGPSAVAFDRHLVLEQLGGWRGMLDASLPTVAFIGANSLGGLRAGIWAAIGAAVLVFAWRLVRRESVQQAFSGVLGVAIAVGIAAASGQARDYYVLGIVRNAAIGAVLLGSIVVRRPLVGFVAEFLAPSHLGAMASHSLPGLSRRIDRARATLHHRSPADPTTGVRPADPEPERHWRDDPRMMRAYSWLTLAWAAVFVVRAAVAGPLYVRSGDGDATGLGVVSLVMGLPLTGVLLLLTLWVVARLHRHRAEPAEPAERESERDPGKQRPAV